ncbi:MAG: hypothetical protein HYT07_02770 [Candidatus Levybacteria bacterium]|nr:hypothetical protein [Candidatus Levybacteria bacterium]
MAYPLIILGAGASFDFQDLLDYEGSNDIIKLLEWRPPLVNKMFDVARLGRIIGNYDDVKPLASTVNNLVKNKNINFDFEKHLSQIESKYPENSYKQIMALRFYLAELFSKISYYYFRHTNNHLHLINEVNNRGGNACVVNFNYDTLFEKNIKTIGNNDNIDAYISGNIKIIKIHGAHNWRYSPKAAIAKTGVYDFFISGGRSFYEEYKDHEVDPTTTKILDYSKENFDLNEYRKSREDKTLSINTWLYYLPAIAIPIGTKGNHVCPKKHINTLIEQLKMVDRILVIGWRVQDEYLLSLLKAHLQNGVKLTVVSSGNTSAKEYIEKFKAIIQIKILDMTFPNNGYTNFMINGGIERFLS